MATVEHNLFEYRLQPIEKVIAALEAAEDAYEAIRVKGPIVERMYRYIFVIYEEALRQPPADSLVMAHRELIRFLDADLLQDFIKNPDDKPTRDVLSGQLAMIAAATTTAPNVEPYDAAELQKAIKGQSNVYNDITFLSTLHRVLHGGDDVAQYYSVLFGLLPAVNPDGIAQEYGWEEALLFAALVHAVWSGFVKLTSERQQFLLQNYYFQAIVVGVPVRSYFQDFSVSNPKLTPTDQMSLLERLLDANREFVPTKTAGVEGRPFVDVLREYMAALYSGEVSTLAQEKTVAAFYRGQNNAEMFTGWLRESLNIIYHLQRHDLVA